MSTSYPSTIGAQLHAVHESLHLSHTPAIMPGRDAQQQSIREFLTDHISSRTGGSLYISGAPGTGKTASIEFVIKQLYGYRILEGSGGLSASSLIPSSTNSSVTPSRLLSKFTESSKSSSTSNSNSIGPRPRVLYTNAMTFSRSPRTLYPKLLAQLNGLTIEEEAAIAPMEALQQLKATFCPAPTASTTSKKKEIGIGMMTIVILDEVDALLSSSFPAVLYSLLEWPLTLGSRLIVIAISNSINLLEQKLPHLVARNALPKSIVFHTYSKEELLQIVRERCESIYPTTEEEEEEEKKKQQLSKEKSNQTNKNKKQKKEDTPKNSTVSDSFQSDAMKSSSTNPSTVPSLSPSDSPTAPIACTPLKLPASSPSPSPSSTRWQPSGNKWQREMEASPILLESTHRMSRSGLSKALSSRKDGVTGTGMTVCTSSKLITSSSSIAELRTATPSKSRKRKKEEEDTRQEETKQDETQLVEEKTTTNMGQVEHAVTPSNNTDTISASPDPLLVTPKKKSKLSIATPSSAVSTTSYPSSPSTSLFGDSLLAPLSTRSTPLFDPFALELLCAKVAKGSGDLRKVLELARKAIDTLAVELESRRILYRTRMATAPTSATTNAQTETPREDRSDGAPSPCEQTATSCGGSFDAIPSPLQVSVGLLHSLMLVGLGSSSDDADLLRSLPSQQKVVLVIAALLAHMQGSKDVLTGFSKHYTRFVKSFQLTPLAGHELTDLLAAIAAHRLIKLVPPTKKRGGGSGRDTIGSISGSGMKHRLVGGSGGGSSDSSPFATIQVNVTLEQLTSAFEEDETITRLILKGKQLATSIIAATKAAAAPMHRDYVIREPLLE